MDSAGWLHVDWPRIVSAEWSPDGTWLLVRDETSLSVVRPADGVIVQTFEARGASAEGALWLDRSRFLVYERRRSAAGGEAVVQAMVGAVGVTQLSDVDAPTGWHLANGHGAVAFATTDPAGRDCGGEACWRYVIWTVGASTEERLGLPAAWSRDGNRLAVIRNDQVGGSNRSAGQGVGAGFDGERGWLEVIEWPGLRSVFSDPGLLVHQRFAFDNGPGGFIALTADRAGVLDLTTGELVHLPRDFGNGPAWDATGQVVTTTPEGVAVMYDFAGREQGRVEGAGDTLVSGSRDGTTQLLRTMGGEDAPPPDGYSVLRGGSIQTVAEPLGLGNVLVWPAVAPDGSALVAVINEPSRRLSRLVLYPLAEN